MGTEMKLYIGGPAPDFLQGDYLEAAAFWNACGWTVIGLTPSPSLAEPYEAHLRSDLEALLRVDALALLPGWQQSSGACVEAMVAASLGIPLMNAKTGEAITADLVYNRQVTGR